VPEAAGRVSAGERPPAPVILLEELSRAGIPAARVLLASDFDGTLLPIVDRPEDVAVTDELRRLVAELAARRPFLICTGRSLSDLRGLIGEVPGLDRIANHGAERRLAESGRDELSVPTGWSEWRPIGLPALREAVARRGGRIEDKAHSIALHYRQSGAEYWSSAEGGAFLRGLLTPAVRLLEGEAAWNLVPSGVSKGEALARHCAELDYRALVYCGDESTDETVFELPSTPALRVIGVRVGSGKTAARYRVADPGELRRWLAQWALDQ
jgi:trehalose 6-phosphate phosphatase